MRTMSSKASKFKRYDQILSYCFHFCECAESLKTVICNKAKQCIWRLKNFLSCQRKKNQKVKQKILLLGEVKSIAGPVELQFKEMKQLKSTISAVLKNRASIKNENREFHEIKQSIKRIEKNIWFPSQNECYRNCYSQQRQPQKTFTQW